MPTAWIITKTIPELVGAFQTAGWEVETSAPPDLVPVSQARLWDLDAIVFEIADELFFDQFREMCRDKLAPMLAVVPNVAFAEQAFAAGADDVMAMPVNPVELLIRAGRLARAGQVVRVGDLAIDSTGHAVKRGDRLIDLSPSEFQLLACLAKHIGEAVSHDEILIDVWRYDITSSGTLEQVKTCVKRLRQKIEPDPRHPQYIISVRRVGYRLNRQEQREWMMRSS